MFGTSSRRDARSVALTLAVAVLLVTAGCQGTPGSDGGGVGEAETTDAPPATTDDPGAGESTTGTRSESRIYVDGPELPVDQNAVWYRVAAMVDTDAALPSTIRVENRSAPVIRPRTPLERALGVPESDLSGAAGVVPQSRGGNVVELNPAILGDESHLESTLAHEYVHVVQLRTRAYWDTAAIIDGDDDGEYSPDEALAFDAVTEGAAEYVERRYARQRLGTGGDPVREQYLNATTVAKRQIAPYYVGSEYVNATVDGPSDLDAIYENPPRTTEELMHGLEPGSEPPAPLSVSTDADRRVRRTGPYGELAVRTLFGTAVNESVAAALADGWGNDTRLQFGGRRDDARGDFAWVLRWDDAANATEFERGVAAYLERRDPNASVRIERAAPETTVLFAGDESFVAQASASGGNASVSVST